ncbi:MAG: PH domain-containing protein [Chitinophagaceae bacterium]|nr:PH domain-containing protein [Chitinophagaceae bacterium]
MKTVLKKDEQVLIVIRQHWLRLVLPFLVWLLITIIFLWWLHNAIAFGIILLAGLYPAFEYISWKNNIWCVTNLRVVDESGFISRRSKESPIDKINNVEYNQTIWGRLLGFGTVDIQTAAELGESIHELIHHPKKLKDTITLAQQQYKESQSSKQAAQLAEALAKNNPVASVASQQLVADELTKLFDLMQKGAITQEEYLIQKSKLMGS